MPVAAIAFGLGACVMKGSAVKPGGMSVLVDELKRRGVWRDLCDALDETLVRKVEVMATLDRARGRKAGARR